MINHFPYPVNRSEDKKSGILAPWFGNSPTKEGYVLSRLDLPYGTVHCTNDHISRLNALMLLRWARRRTGRTAVRLFNHRPL